MIYHDIIDKLKISVFNSKSHLGIAAADLAEEIIQKVIKKKGRAVIILATGASQFEFLDSLTQRNLEWKKVIAFHLDEYVGLSQDHPASFRRYLRERFIDKTGIGEFFPINGDCQDVQAECTRLENLFKQYTVDIAFTGIGENGHLAFNEPPAALKEKSAFKVIRLNDDSRQQQLGEGWFKTLDEVPLNAITMTISAIMKSKQIICTVPDRRKADAVYKTLMEEISPWCPSSVLRKHPSATLFLDLNSASLILDSNAVNR